MKIHHAPRPARTSDHWISESYHPILHKDPTSAPCGKTGPQTTDPAEITCKNCLRWYEQWQRSEKQQAEWVAREAALNARIGLWEIYDTDDSGYRYSEHVEFVAGKQPTSCGGYPRGPEGAERLIRWIEPTEFNLMRWRWKRHLEEADRMWRKYQRQQSYQKKKQVTP